MPRYHKRDITLTALLFENSFFLDKRSFVSLPSPTDPLCLPHLFLRGDDVGLQRERVFKRDKGICRKCGAKVPNLEGEVHHVLPKGRGGWDDLSNLEWRCSRFVRPCHSAEHVETRFGESKKQAAEDFQKLYPENQEKPECQPTTQH
jgi:hypothetical protein